MLKVVNLTKTFQDNKVIDDLSLSFDDGIGGHLIFQDIRK
jgi:ABC-type uncharacterized transport system ATPase subunit